jgi:hypothetical protein
MAGKFLSAVIATFLLLSSHAQSVNGCGFKIPPRTIKAGFKSVYEARDIINGMLDTIRWKENFTLQERNGIQNAYATVINNMRWIIYDNNFLEDIDEYAKTKWASISVLAHEMGHHYYNHVVSGKGSTIPTEIEADAFSGYVMAKLGATLDQSVVAIQTIATDKASSTHPAKKDRVDAISRGWNLAAVKTTTPTTPPQTGKPGTGTNPNPSTTGGNNSGGNTGTNPNPSTQSPADTDPSWISLTIQSIKDETVQLSDDGKTYQPATIKTGDAFVFKFDIYSYGWLRLKYYNGYRVYKLMHGVDYSILWNRRTKNWTVVTVPD